MERWVKYYGFGLKKGDDKYIFIFTEDQRSMLPRIFARFVRNRKLNFGWKEAKKLSERLRKSPLFAP